jgi:hypothetical protein
VPATLQVDSDGTPLRNGTMAAPFTIAIPCAALGEDGVALPAVVRGHGLFDSNRGVIVRIGYDALPELHLIEGATDWTGFTQADLLFVFSALEDIDLAPALADRGRQGLLNTIVLARMMKMGEFNRDPAFQRSDGSGFFADSEGEVFFAGSSLGAYMGLGFAALSPDVTNVYADVGGINLLGVGADRSALGQQLDDDPLQHALLTSLAHELLVRADGAGYASHVTDAPLPGVNRKNVLLTMSWLDQYSANLTTEIAARSMGLPSLDGSLWSGVPQIADRPGPLSSAFVVYDSGAFDLNDPAHAAFIPPLANLPAAVPRGACEPHVLRISIPAAAQQLQAFLRPGGRIENFCNGRCDAAEPLELPDGDDMPCDPVSE